MTRFERDFFSQTDKAKTAPFRGGFVCILKFSAFFGLVTCSGNSRKSRSDKYHRCAYREHERLYRRSESERGERKHKQKQNTGKQSGAQPLSPHFLAEMNAPTNAEINSAASASGAEYFSGSGKESPTAAEIKRDTAPHAMPQSVPFTTHAKMLLFSADLRIIASETFLFYTYARLGQIMLLFVFLFIC